MRNGKVKMGLMAAVGVAMLWLCLAVPALAGPLEDGAAAYERKDYATALQLWRALADQGDATAQFLLGGMYGEGEGVPQDDAQAVVQRVATAQPGPGNDTVEGWKRANQIKKHSGAARTQVEAHPAPSLSPRACPGVQERHKI